MTTYTIPIEVERTKETLDARVTVERALGGPGGVNTSILVFAEDASVVVWTDKPRRFIDYCLHDVLYMALDDLATRRGVEYEDIYSAIEAQGFTCECED